MHTYIAESERFYPIFGNTLSVSSSKWGIITLQCNILTMLIVSFVALNGWNIADTAKNTRQSFVRFVISQWLWVNQIYPWKLNTVIENHDLILMHVIVSGIIWVDHIDSIITT